MEDDVAGLRGRGEEFAGVEARGRGGRMKLELSLTGSEYALSFVCSSRREERCPVLGFPPMTFIDIHSLLSLPSYF